MIRIPGALSIILGALLVGDVALKLFFVRAWRLRLISFGQDLLVISAFSAILMGSFALPGQTATALTNGLLFTGSAAVAVYLFVYHYYFDHFASLNFNFLKLRWRDYRFFWQYFISQRFALFLGGLVILAAAGSAALITLTDFYWSIPKIPLAIFGLAVLVVNAFLFSKPLTPVSSSLFHLIIERQIMPITVTDQRPLAFTEPGVPTSVSAESPIKRIFIFVLESVSDNYYHHYYNPRGRIQLDFLQTIEKQALTFTNYFTNNLDSRGTLYAMLYGRFFPFEAYRLPKKMCDIFHQPNLVEWCQRQGYASAFAIASQRHDTIIDFLPWDQFIKLGDQLPTDQFVCIAPRLNQRFEPSCEDATVFAPITEFVQQHQKTLVVQELVVDHAEIFRRPEYLNVRELEYFNTYFEKFYRFLGQSNMLTESLIVITADHGSRNAVESHKITNYHVPLVVIQPHLTAQRIETFLSSVDFPHIIAELLNNRLPKSHSQELPLVGASFTDIVGLINDQHQFVFARNSGLLGGATMPTAHSATARLLHGITQRRAKITAGAQQNELAHAPIRFDVNILEK